MRVISNKALVSFAKIHPAAHLPLQAWRKAVESRSYKNFAELKSVFNSVDVVKQYHVFNVGGNNYRIITVIKFTSQVLYVRHVFTHKEYDSWKP